MTDKITVYNHEITAQRIVAILISFTLVFIPFSIFWLYSIRSPDDFIERHITSKRTRIKIVSAGYGGGLNNEYCVTIAESEFVVSVSMYNKLRIGNYISAGYRKDMIYYYTKI